MLERLPVDGPRLTAVMPLVSCIMPTNGRRGFVGAAVAYFLRQDYPARELIVIDDGQDAVGDLIPDDERIRYVRLHARASVGRKRNVACEAARGEIIAHWDDDDWHARDRLTRQIQCLSQTGADLCGASRLRFYDPRARRAWEYRYPDNLRRWVAGGTLAYRREFWRAHPFDDIDVGEDALFVWKAAAERVAVMDDASFYLATVHASNVSPKATESAYWTPCPVDLVELQLGSEIADLNARFGAHTAAPGPVATSHNVHACLVHEQPACIADLIRNLRHTDPDSTILLYNGSSDPRLLDFAFPFEAYGVVKHPTPKPMRWGWLHEFGLDAMRFASQELGAQTMTIVDSDQLALKPGYATYLAAFLSGKTDIGLLGSSTRVETATTVVGPAAQAWKEVERWRPLLRQFPGGEQHFARWTFWPATVFTAPAMAELPRLFARDKRLTALLDGTAMWATEEILFPTLTALLGYQIAENPCSNALVRYRVPTTDVELERARHDPAIFWIHPVTRDFDDPVRANIRAQLDGYPERSGSATRAAGGLLLTLPILNRMRSVSGWLTDDEADALIATARQVVNANPEATIVELGSYCGRGTATLASVVQALAPEARVYAIDAHDGCVGVRGARSTVLPPSAPALRETLRRFALEPFVVCITAEPACVPWERTIDYLLVDALHDYASVAADFTHYEPYLAAEAIVAFHDDAPYFPGVQQFVRELRAAGTYRHVLTTGSLTILIRRQGKPS